MRKRRKNMATIFSHPAVPIGIALALGQKKIPRALAVMGCFACCAADLDVIGFPFGIPYGSQFGHRGFTHSIFMAAMIALLCAWRLPKEKDTKDLPPKRIFAYIFAVALSHPLIDMTTDGGKGIALLWPFSAQCFFWPWRPLPVSPIGKSFFSPYGLHVFLSELCMIWLPCLALGGAGWLARRALAARKETP
ncbi:MAG: metal-dependent hydrolase [Alphaproteobacteria bacterium]|nr:metal-dependent hydrolase [Alphaproteobacteria bacterium]